MPRLHRAKTVACGLLKWGMCAWMVSVHSVTRGWQDIRFLLGCMGYIAIHTTPEGRRVLPLCIEGSNTIDSKTYPRKGGSRGIQMPGWVVFFSEAWCVVLCVVRRGSCVVPATKQAHEPSLSLLA